MIRHLQYNNTVVASDWTIRYIKDLLAHVWRLGLGGAGSQHRSARGELSCEVQQFVNLAYSRTVAFCMDATVTRNAGVVVLLKITHNGRLVAKISGVTQLRMFGC